jgi:hypothetical protein
MLIPRQRLFTIFVRPYYIDDTTKQPVTYKGDWKTPSPNKSLTSFNREAPKKASGTVRLNSNGVYLYPSLDSTDHISNTKKNTSIIVEYATDGIGTIYYGGYLAPGRFSPIPIQIEGTWHSTGTYMQGNPGVQYTSWLLEIDNTHQYSQSLPDDALLTNLGATISKVSDEYSATPWDIGNDGSLNGTAFNFTIPVSSGLSFTTSLPTTSGTPGLPYAYFCYNQKITDDNFYWAIKSTVTGTVEIDQDEVYLANSFDHILVEEKFEFDGWLLHDVYSSFAVARKRIIELMEVYPTKNIRLGSYIPIDFDILPNE